MWGALALDHPDPDDVDRALDRGCVGLSLPAGALAGVDRLARLRPVLARLERRGAPLFVHPGPGPAPATARDRTPLPAPVRPRSATRSGGRRSRTTSPTCTRPSSRSSPPDGPSTPSCGSSSRCSPASRRCTQSAWPRAAARRRVGARRRPSSPGPHARPARLLRHLLLRAARDRRPHRRDRRPGPAPVRVRSPRRRARAAARAGRARLGAARRRHRARLRLRRRRGVSRQSPSGAYPRPGRAPEAAAAAQNPQTSRSRGRRLSDENPPRLRTPPARPGPDRPRAAGVRRRARRSRRSCGSTASTTTTPSASTRNCSPTST